MALLADQSAEVNSNLVGGAGSQSKRFTMPGNVAIKVESVVATVNNGAGSAVTPELTIRDQSGVVIATTKQDASIPAGDTGTATYALRLNGNFGTAAGFIRYDVHNQGGYLEIETTSHGGTFAAGVSFEVAEGDFAVFIDPATGDTFRVSAPLFFLDANGGIFRFLNSSLFDVVADAFAVVTTDGVSLQTADTTIGIDPTEEAFVSLATGQTLTVYDHLQNPIFRVDEDGDLHGKTGKALTFDL